jgi:hypothetical protein
MVKNKKTLKRLKNKHFKKNHCSPKTSKSNVSCLDDKLLLKIADILNQYNGTNITENKCKNTLHKQISEKMSEISDCKSEKCWSSIHEIIRHLSPEELSRFKESFKPNMPEKWKTNPTEWLSTSDIEKCLKQYEESNKGFKCYGALPMDFALKRNNSCVSGDLCNIDIKKHMDNGEHSISSVFNLDDHDEPGSHWVSVYMDLNGRNRGIPSMYYFDSMADKPTKEIKELYNNVKTQYKNATDKELDFLYNDIRHQKKNTECGVYSIHFITTMLQGIDFNEYIKEIKSDDFMNKFREFYFVKE